ncbi:hypothetical protein R1sor_006528 [Riccia sorocarpa]|uniref:Uncharacterized protein n=1 Tax=Riccia sorocarpa TaxID=122646 RepID=A0ABD3HRA8_9MARC
MNQGMQEGGAGLATTEDPYNASASTEVADYSNDLPVIDPPIPIPASQRVDFIPEQENSDARLHNPGGEVNQSAAALEAGQLLGCSRAIEEEEEAEKKLEGVCATLEIVDMEMNSWILST